MSPPFQNFAPGERDPGAIGAVGKEVNHLAVPTSLSDCRAVGEIMAKGCLRDIP